MKVPAIRVRGCRPYTGAASVVLSLTWLAGLPGYTGGRGFSRGAREILPPRKFALVTKFLLVVAVAAGTTFAHPSH